MTIASRFVTMQLDPPLTALARLLLLLTLLSHAWWAPAPEACASHNQCGAGEFCGILTNSTTNASLSGCVECAALCTTPSEPSGCNLPCTAVDGDCCTQQFRSNCQARQVFYSGPIIPCSLCDSAIVSVQTKGVSVDTTLKPSAQMMRDMAAGLSPRTEAFPCERADSTLVGNLSLSCVQTADDPPTLQGSAQNCSRRTYAATEGFRYSQDPGWQNEAASPETGCGGISLVAGFNPLISLGVEGVGRCQNADAWATWGREPFVGPDWVDGEHEHWESFCIDCDVETGYEGGTATIRTYRDKGCSPLGHSRLTHVTVDRCSFDSGRQTRYTATCDVSSFSCPRPEVGVQVSMHRSMNPDRAATCASEPELVHAFAAEMVGMDQCVQVSRNNTATAVLYRSLRVCCTASAIRIRYYVDQDCSVAGHADDNLEYQRGCHSIMDAANTLEYVQAVCSTSIPRHHCPPVYSVSRAGIIDNADSLNTQTGSTLTAVAVLVVVAAAIVIAVAASLIAVKFYGWDYRKTLFGTSATLAVEEKVSQPKEVSEKQKIFAQYRTASHQDMDKLVDTSVPASNVSVASLPGSTTFDDDAEFVKAARMASKAAAESNAHKKKQSGHHSRENNSPVHSSSGHSRGRHPDRGKLRSKSLAPAKHHGRKKEELASVSTKNHSRKKERLRSTSEGTRRRALQHNLKEMRNLEESKNAVVPDGHRGDSFVACRALFDRIDIDGSGALDRNEIAMLATKMGRGLKSDELDAAMAAMDKDGNGTIEFDEFYTWYSSSSRSMTKAEIKVLTYLKRSKNIRK